ncbi:MAG: hypothetical protein WD709_00220 [Gammaproteobacteria bacterium]
MSGKLSSQLRGLIETLDSNRVRFALIGGLALASHKVIRATQDIDLLVDFVDADRLDTLLIDLGYKCLHRSADAGNYQKNDERIDLLYARRPIAQKLLSTAVKQTTSFGVLRIVSAEGLIGFKLQAYVNDPRRGQDIDDIRSLIRENYGTINMNEVRGYFKVFDQESLLDELIGRNG